MARARVSDAAERTLDAWLTGLMEGQVRIQDLPLCVSAWFHAGEAYGRASRQPEIDRLEHEANVLWMRAFTPKERHAEYQRRLDEHFRLENERFFNACSERDPHPAKPVGPPQDSEMAEPGSVDTESTYGNQAVSSPQPGVHDPQTVHGTNVAA